MLKSEETKEKIEKISAGKERKDARDRTEQSAVLADTDTLIVPNQRKKSIIYHEVVMAPFGETFRESVSGREGER